MGKKFLPRFLCVLSRNGNFLCTSMCALEMKKKISKARVQTPNDIKSLSLFLSFFLASQERSLCPHIVFRICALRTPVFDRVFKTLGMIIIGSIKTSRFIPRTPVLVRVFQTLEMTIFGSAKTSVLVPRTSFLVQHFKQFQVSLLSHSPTKSFLLFRTLLQSPR